MKKALSIVSIIIISLLLTACSNSSNSVSKEQKEQFVVGNHVTFGQYSGMSKKQPLDWIVLDVQDNRALLISQYGIISKQYYSAYYQNTTWGTSDIRLWLNQDFYNEAFSSSEKKRILLTNVDNSKSQGFKYNNTNGGANTKDYVFLLSYSEYENYFSDRESAICHPLNKKNSVCAWWLRSPGVYQHSAMFVRTDGSAYSKEAGTKGNYIRPACWISLGD